MKKLLLTLSVLALLIVFPMTANAEIGTEDDIEVNRSYTDNLSSASEEDRFYFTLDDPGSVTVQISTDSSNTNNPWSVTLYEIQEDGTNVSLTYNYVGKTRKFSFNKRRLPEGEYFITVKNWNYTDSDYEVYVKYEEETSQYFEKEYNNSPGAANQIKLNKTYTANLSEISDNDYFQFNLTKPGSVTVEFSPEKTTTNNSWSVGIYSTDDNGDLVLMQHNYIGKLSKFSFNKRRLPKGEYYVKVANWNFSNNDYSIKAKYSAETSAKYETESNNSEGEADKITIGKTYTGNLSDSSDKDFYKFSLSSSKKVAVTFNCKSSNNNSYSIYVYKINSDGSLKNLTHGYIGKNSKNRIGTFKLSKGNYLVSISNWNFINNDYTINASYVK